MQRYCKFLTYASSTPYKYKNTSQFSFTQKPHNPFRLQGFLYLNTKVMITQR